MGIQSSSIPRTNRSDRALKGVVKTLGPPPTETSIFKKMSEMLSIFRSVVLRFTIGQNILALNWINILPYQHAIR